jgi:hypothetical protein
MKATGGDNAGAMHSGNGTTGMAEMPAARSPSD